ncbi:MAG: class I SAM-dependent methyltransferase [bacterium]
MDPIEPHRLVAFYDAHGAKQDRVAWYEDRALDRLVEHAALDRARAVLELGAGTGRLARRLLDGPLPPDATYLAVDQSPVMCALTRERLAPYADRAAVVEAPVDTLDPPPVDRVVTAYLLDILPDDALAALIDRSHRWLEPGGLFALASLTHGVTPLGRLVSRAWTAIHRRRPLLVGGCRPLTCAPHFTAPRWRIEHHSVIESWGVPSEVLVARRLPENDR